MERRFRQTGRLLLAAQRHGPRYKTYNDDKLYDNNNYCCYIEEEFTLIGLYIHYIHIILRLGIFVGGDFILKDVELCFFNVFMIASILKKKCPINIRYKYKINLR